ncbi:hypothetical protein [Aeromonas jandaei]|uniref:hypothetical protein n=1 Tax=Aeromonas jandaei TaxID=650 RepID=UPI003BA3AFC8
MHQQLPYRADKNNGKSNQDKEKAECHKVIQIAPAGFAKTPTPGSEGDQRQRKAETERL